MYHLYTFVISGALALLAILIHYEVMLLTSDRLIPWGLRHAQGRRTVMVALIVLMLGHITEIWMFAVAFLVLHNFPGFGGFQGQIYGDFTDYLYFSATNYTSLGFGDIIPTGSIRTLAVSETLTGLLMIAWSASFTYLKMEQIWQIRTRKRQKFEDDKTE